MELKSDTPPELPENEAQADVVAGRITISPSALSTALNYVRYEKEAAVNSHDYDSLSGWRDTEKNIMAALGGLGLG